MTMSFMLAATQSPVFSGDASSLFFRIVASLGLILILIYLLFWLLNKRSKFSRNSLYQRLGGIPLGTNKSVQILEIGNKVYVLGVGDDVTLINILETTEDILELKLSFDGQNNPKSGFLGLFNRKGLRRPKAGTVSQFEAELAEKIEQLKEVRSSSVNQWLDETNERIGNKKSHE